MLLSSNEIDRRINDHQADTVQTVTTVYLLIWRHMDSIFLNRPYKIIIADIFRFLVIRPDVFHMEIFNDIDESIDMITVWV